MHAGVMSGNKCLGTNSVVFGTTNLGASKHPWLESVCTCNNMIFQFSQIDTMFTPMNSIEEGHQTRGDTYRGTRRRCRGTRRSRRTRRRQNRWTRVERWTTRCRQTHQKRLVSGSTRLDHVEEVLILK